MSAPRTTTTSGGSVVDLIDRALDATGCIVDGVRPEQWSAPTPCPGWDVRTLVNHLVGGMRIFTAQIHGQDAPDHDGTDWLSPDPTGAHHAAAAQDSAAWHTPGALTRPFTLSFGTVPGPMAAVVHLTEVVVHGLDLAVATGQESGVDQPLAGQLLTLMQGMGGMDAFRVPGVFGPELAAPAGAPQHEHLMAFLGRRL